MSAHLQDELLTAALDDSLSGADREAVDAHLAVCAQCRGDLELARAGREALRSLPNEIRPPIDVAAAVAAEFAGGERERPAATAAAPSGPPRWYRAAGLVAAAAAIALAVLIVPRVTGGEHQDRSLTAAVGAEAGSAPEAGGSGPTTSEAARPIALEVSPTDYDLAELQGLLADAKGLSPTPSALDTAAAQLTERDRRALDCVRRAAGASLPADAPAVRLIDASFRGTPATIGVFSLPDGRGGVWVAARGDCRLLARAG